MRFIVPFVLSFLVYADAGRLQKDGISVYPGIAAASVLFMANAVYAFRVSTLLPPPRSGFGVVASVATVSGLIPVLPYVLWRLFASNKTVSTHSSKQLSWPLWLYGAVIVLSLIFEIVLASSGV